MPLSQWHYCHHQCKGIVADITIALLPSLRWRYHQHCMGTVAFVAPVLSSLLRWPLCPHIAWVSSLPLHQCCCPCWAGMFAPLHWCHCPCHAVIVALGALSLVPSSCRPFYPCCVCVVQLICRRLSPRWAGMYLAVETRETTPQKMA